MPVVVPTPTGDEHPFIEAIRFAIEAYRREWPSHENLDILVHQHGYVHQGPDKHNPLAKFRIEVSFTRTDLHSELDSIRTTCRPKFVTGASAWSIQAKRANRYIPIRKFLRTTFLVEESPLILDPKWDWSVEETKPFNWTGLPTELKEQVIENCLHHPTDEGAYSMAVSRCKARTSFNKEIGPYEITEQLGDWWNILRVSKQVRAIAIRLCVRGSSDLILSKGLCIETAIYWKLHESLTRLGRYYQMVDSDSVPVDDETLALAHNYNQFPGAYPHLSRYATMRHGIRIICLNMGYTCYMNFLRVQTGGFKEYQSDRLITYEALEQLPCLEALVIKLPLRPRKGWKDDTYKGGPPVFHPQGPCPRILHRVIYERAADVLARYEKVLILNFIDDGEKQRYDDLRQKAILKQPRFTKNELQELYANEEGGIELEDVFESAVSAPTKEDEDSESVQDEEGFFPPKCQCQVACINEAVFR